MYYYLYYIFNLTIVCYLFLCNIYLTLYSLNICCHVCHKNYADVLVESVSIDFYYIAVVQ